MDDSPIVPTDPRKEDKDLAEVSKNAFLVEANTRIYLLNRLVINIGRRLENHVVIDDLRVSRYHAQIRSVQGRFIIFDLSSTGGTFVNGKRVEQSVIYPGDTISLAGVELVFKQSDSTLRSDLKQTAPF